MSHIIDIREHNTVINKVIVDKEKDMRYIIVIIIYLVILAYIYLIVRDEYYIMIFV